MLTSMQHPRGIRGLVPGGVSVWTREQIVHLPPEEYRAMSALIDEAGVRSARAQGLPAPITSTVRKTSKQKNGTRWMIHSSLTPPVPTRPTAFTGSHARGPAAVPRVL